MQVKRVSFLVLLLFIQFGACSRNSEETAGNFYERGVSLASEGEFEKALDALKKALNASVDRKPAQESFDIVQSVLSGKLKKAAAISFFKGVVHENKSEYVQAYSYLSKAIRIAPDFADAYYERGSISGSLNYYDKAVSDFTKAAELNPGDAEAFNNRGLAYAKGFSDYQNAIADFSEAIRVNPEFAEAYENRGIAYMKQTGNKEMACADWKNACNLHRCDSYNRAMENRYCK